jgi:hypothetical protein
MCPPHAGQAFAQFRRHRPPAGDDLGQPAHLGHAHGGADVAQPVVEPGLGEGEPAAGPHPSVAAEQLEALGQHVVVGHHHAALAGGDHLAGVEAVAADVAQAPARPPVVRGAQGAGGVLQHGQPVLTGELQARAQVRGQPEQVHRHDRPRSRRQVALEVDRLDVVGVGLHVDEHGHRTLLDHDVGRRREGEVGHEHLVAGADAERHQGQVHRRRAGAGGEGVPAPGHGGDHGLELLDLGALAELARRQHRADLGQLVVAGPGSGQRDPSRLRHGAPAACGTSGPSRPARHRASSWAGSR